MTQPSIQAVLTDRLRRLEDRLRAACQRAGRPREAVTLIAVTKTVGVDAARLLPALGVCDLGENRPQELWRKAESLPNSIRWHLIGHLQRNKIERTLPLVQMIHSIDSSRLLSALDDEAVRRQQSISVLLEVNASREPNKQGFAPEDLPGLTPQIAALRQVRVRGLMTMAALEEEPEHCRPTFVSLRESRDHLQTELGPAYPLDELSMGMTNDFEIAVEEGATLVRIGTALFEGLS
jgi:pyridoxal phosphate enzyme (YggS family)